MSKAQQIAKLEALLVRVGQRRSEPRKAVQAAPMASSFAPVAAAVSVPPAVSTPAPAPSRAPAPVVPPSSAGDLPDLDLVETTTSAGETRSSLIPAAGGDESEAEFDIPAHDAPPRVAAPAALDLDTAPLSADSIEIDRAPLAVMTIPPAPNDDIDAIDLEGPGRIPQARVPPTTAAPSDEVEEIEPADLELPVSAAPSSPQHYKATVALPSAQIARVVAPAPIARARTFHELVERSLALRTRR